MSFSFHPDAESEFIQAIDYYESWTDGLGYDFAVEVYSAIGRIVTWPTAWPVLEGEVRRCQTRRFPYGILYAQERDGILVLAVMHLHRIPGHWKRRLK